MLSEEKTIKLVGSLIEDFPVQPKFLLTRDVIEHREAIQKEFDGELVMIFTDPYGAAGFLAYVDDLEEAIQDYIMSLEPESDEEVESWRDSMVFRNLKEL